jgi:hypothetical protein
MPWLKLELYSLVNCFQNQLKTSLILNYWNKKNALKLILLVSSNKKRERENQSCSNIFALYYISPTTFFFLFFCWAGGGGGGSTWCTQILTTRTRSNIFFITFLFISCVCDGLWGVAKRQEMFFFLCCREKETRNQTESKHEKERNGTVLYRRRMGLQKPKSGRSQMCVHWISLVEIILNRISCFHFFSFVWGGGRLHKYTVNLLCPNSQILSQIIIRFKKNKGKCIWLCANRRVIKGADWNVDCINIIC